MKLRLFLFFLILNSAFIIHNSFSQNPLVKQWDYRFGGTKSDRLYSIISTADGGYILCGKTNSFGSGLPSHTDVYVVKTDSSGTLSWSQSYGSNLNDEGYDACQSYDGGYIITGWSKSFGLGLEDVYVIKTNATLHPHRNCEAALRRSNLY